MKKQTLLTNISAGLVILGLSSTADAVLIERLGGLAYYDDVADLTWLADANAAGAMNWPNANAWAANLDVVGVSGWRIADTLQPDASCSNHNSGDTVSFGLNCTGSEMGNLFYNVLGGVANTSITTTHNADYDLFSNVQSGSYWTGTRFAEDFSAAWRFNFDDGSQNIGAKGSNYFAWAVQSGDVSTVPAPAVVVWHWLTWLGRCSKT